MTKGQFITDVGVSEIEIDRVETQKLSLNGRYLPAVEAALALNHDKR